MAYMRYTIWIDSNQSSEFSSWLAENIGDMVIDYDWEDTDDA